MAAARAVGEDRAPRRRRSALQTPAFVDRMDIADDAEGRVAIFSVEETPVDAPTGAAPASEPPGSPARFDRLGPWLDGPYTAVVVAVALAAVLILGLVLLRR